jgi:4-hydroxyphenylpyruvate dioxygenase
LAYAGSETGVGQNVLCIEARQNPYCINDPHKIPIHEHLRKHGDGVKVAARVEDATSAYEETMKRGARSLWSYCRERRTRRSGSLWNIYLMKRTFGT